MAESMTHNSETLATVKEVENYFLNHSKSVKLFESSQRWILIQNELRERIVSAVHDHVEDQKQLNGNRGKTPRANGTSKAKAAVIDVNQFMEFVDHNNYFEIKGIFSEANKLVRGECFLENNQL